MKKNEQIKILLIFSDETVANEIIHALNSHIKTVFLNLDYVVNPSRPSLETILFENKYLFVIPFGQYIKSNGSSYHLIHFLNSLDINYYGCDYTQCLMVNDTYAFLKNVNAGIPTKIVTRYYTPSFENDFFPARIVLEESKKGNALIYNQSQLKEIVDEMFESSKKAEEIVVQKAFDYDKKIVITIIGNSPYLLKCINIYATNNLAESVMENDANIIKMLNNACEKFEFQSFRDYAQFIYMFNSTSGEYYLSSVNVTNILNEYIEDYFTQHYALSSEYIIYTYILAYLIRQNDVDQFCNAIDNILEIFPEEITAFMLPLENKLHKASYSYQDICKEMQKRFLAPDESNKYQITSFLQKALTSLPDIQSEYAPLLGDDKSGHEFLHEHEDIPIHPQSQEKTLLTSLQILNGQMRWHAPTSLHNVNPPVMFSTVVASAITHLYNPNALEKKTSAGLLKMEQQIVRQLSGLAGWDINKSGGTFTTGGKICMTYAIKCGINRCSQMITKDKHPVVITSEINHFSVESSCQQLGLGSEDCIRIPTGANETIDFEYFEQVLTEKIRNHIPIACIVFSGGNTTHCNAEDIRAGVAIVNKIRKENHLPYKPFIYYDLVVGWPWLFYKDYDFPKNYLNIPSSTLEKIEYSTQKIKYTYLADAFGVDFHKAGFSPNTNSVIVLKNRTDLYGLALGGNDSDYLEPYRYTFSNSRTATSIISAWNALQSAGREGFQAYIANIITSTNIFAAILPEYHFEILGKNATYGFTTIIWCCLPTETNSFYEMSDPDMINRNNNYLFALSEYWSKNERFRFSLRFMPNYKSISENVYLAALSILPMTLNLNEENASAIAKELGNEKLVFDQIFEKDQNTSYGEIPSDVPK